MPLFFIDFQDTIINLKQIQSVKKHIHYDVEKQAMSYDIVFNDGLNEMFNKKYEFHFETEKQMEYHYAILKEKLEKVDYFVFL